MRTLDVERIVCIVDRIPAATIEASPPGSPLPRLDLEMSRPIRGGRPRLLLVDDDRAFRAQVRELLEDEGFEVIGEGEDGEEGVRLAEELRPDVVLMDIRMPHLGGIDATRIIRERTPNLPVIVLSAYEDASLLRGAESVGVYCYLVKGCRPDLIAEMILAAHAFAGEQALRQDLGQDPRPSAP